MADKELMQAALLDGPKQPFKVASVARPRPKSGEVLVRIKASGVNPLDLKIRAGQAARAPPTSRIPIQLIKEHTNEP
jgi:NADPH:quinone reductase